MICKWLLAVCALTESFKKRKFLISIQFNSSISSFTDSVFGAESKKSSPTPRSQRFLPIFSSRTFMFLCVIFRCMVHFYFIFMWCKIQLTGESSQSFTVKYAVSSRLFIDALYQVQSFHIFMALSMLIILYCTWHHDVMPCRFWIGVVFGEH